MSTCIIELAALVVCATSAFGQATEEAEHSVVLEVGATGDWGLTGGPSSLGGTFEAEVTPIERWLELEAGVTALGTNGRRELEADVLFKKPFQLSRTIEFMPGIGPAWSWKLSGSHRTPAVATEIALDFMFWRSKTLGWYLEPSCDFAGLGPKSDRSLGVTLGLLVGLP